MKWRAFFVFILLAGFTTQAEVIVGHGFYGPAQIKPSSLQGYESWAQSFTTPSITYELTSVTASLDGNGSLVVASLWDTRPDPSYSFLPVPGNKIASLGSA